MSDLIHGLNSLNKALPAYEEAESFYNGTVSEIFSTDVIRKVLGRGYNHFTFNYARQVVTSRLSRMEVASITSTDANANSVLETVWNSNALDQEIQDSLEAALVFGDSYLIAGPNEDNTGIDIFYNDPKNTRVFYDPENPRKKAYAIKRWESGDKLRINLYYADRLEKYISKGKLTSTVTEADFEEYFEDGQTEWPLPNETGSIPVFHLRTGRMYGRPEHKNSFGPQNAINKLLTVQISAIDYASFPQRYFLEDPAANSGVNPQKDFMQSDFGSANPIVDLDDDYADSMSALKAGPGGVWSLQGVKAVGQFDVASPDTFVTPFNTYVNALATSTQTPMHIFQVGSLPSGESLRAAEAPLNKRVESLELLFGGVLREVNEFVLSLVGLDAPVSVTWAPVATYDDSSMWSTIEAKTIAGMPLYVALKEAGYTQAQMEEWFPEGPEKARPAAQVDVLADAIQKVSAAVALGVISAEEARNLLPQDILNAVYTPPVISAVLPPMAPITPPVAPVIGA